MAACPQPAPKKVYSTPKADQCVVGPPRPLPPPQEVVDALGTTELFVGVDVETHQLAPRNKTRGSVGKFGLWSADLGETCAELRIVQLGWCIGRLDAERPETKVKLIKPSGFVVDPAATAVHRVTQERAAAEGEDLSEVLGEMLADVLEATKGGGRVVAHNLAFDGEIIQRELERAGLGEKVQAWGEIVAGGLCTMMPHITHWVRRMAGMNDIDMYRRMGLKDMIKILLQNGLEMSRGHHDAGNDAQMHWYICRELKRYVQQAPAETQ